MRTLKRYIAETVVRRKISKIQTIYNAIIINNQFFIVYGSCSITYGGVRYSVKHGRRHFDYCNCRECVCYFGQLYCDETQTSCRIRCSNNTRTCTLEDGSVLAHGESIESDCNRLDRVFGIVPLSYCSSNDIDHGGTYLNTCMCC